MKIDLWYGHEFKKGKYRANAFFTPGNGYSGNIFDETGKPIGDYRTRNSVEIPKYFRMEWLNS